MPDHPAIFVLEVKGGRALPEAMRLEGGRRLDPIDFGSRGRWHVTGPGVLPIHGHLMFDGAHLFVRSADPAHPLRVGGATVAGEWERVTPSARVTAGDVEIVFAAASATPRGDSPTATVKEDLEATRIEPLEPPEPARGALLDATIVDSPESALAAMGLPSAPPRDDPAATRVESSPPGPAIARVAPPLGHPAPIDVPPPLPAVPTAPPPPGRLRAYWRRTSTAQRAGLLAVPLAVFVVRTLVLDRPPSHPREPDRVASAPRAVSPARAPIPPLGHEDAHETVPARLSPSPAPTGSTKTPARLAVDALSAGAYREAVVRYDALAQEYPDRTVFREAARILRAKIDAGPPP